MVDWSNVDSVSDFMNFHKDEISIQNDQQAGKIIERAFDDKPTVSLMRKFQLT